MQPADKVIRLDQFLKLLGVADTGGQAKMLVQGGQAKVNGAVETRRGRKLHTGDVVEVGGKTFAVTEESLQGDSGGAGPDGGAD
jgi:ribosome-associated protein